ncbi:unnamed protein product [Sphacelaria rigidula]
MTEEFWSPPSPLQKQEESDTLTKEQEQGGQTEQEAPAKRVFSAVDDCEVAEGEHEKWKRAGGGVRGGVEEPVVGKRSDSFYSCSSAGGEGGMDGAKGEHRRGDGSGDSDEDDEWDEEEPAETRRMTVLSKRNNNEPLTSESATRRDGYASCSSSRLGGGSSGDEDVKSGNRRMTVLSNRDKILVPSDNEVCRDRNVGSSSRSSGGSSDEEVEPGNRRMTVLSKGNRIRLESSAERQDGGANGSKSGGGDDPILPPVFIGTQRNGSERSSSSRSSSSSDDDLEPRDRRLTVLSKRKQTRLPSLAQRDGSCKPSSSSSSNSGNAISGGGDDGFGFAPSAGSSKMTMINHADREQEQGGDLEDVDAGDALHTKVDHCKAKRVAESRERARVFASDVLGVDVVDGYDDGDGRSESMGSPEGERVQRLSLPLSSCELSPTQLLVAANSDTDSKSNTPIAAAIEQLRANENSCPAQRGQAPTSPPTSPNLSPVSKSSTITTNPSAFTIAAGTSALPHIPTDATANITTAASSCHDHVERLKPFNFQSFRCRCVAGEEAAEISRELLCSALEKEIHGKFHEAMDECLTAVELCDDDRELHEAVCRISVKIGTWLS